MLTHKGSQPLNLDTVVGNALVNSGKWTFECAALGMVIEDINEVIQQYKEGAPFRGYVPPPTPTLIAPAKVCAKRTFFGLP